MARPVAFDKSAATQMTMLRNVLRLEAKYGYSNSAVTDGGLDMMWPNLGNVAAKVRNLAPMGGRPYATLTLDERQAWAKAAHRALSQDFRADPSNRKETATQPPRKPHEVTLATPVEELTAIHYRSRQTLKELGITSLRDALWHAPLRYINYTRRTPIARLVFGTEATVVGDVVDSRRVQFGGRTRAARTRVRDETGTLQITWFNMPYMAERWVTGDRIVVSGKVGEFRGWPTMENPEYDDYIRKGKETSSAPIHAGTVIPVYPAREGLNQRSLRTALRRAVEIGVPLLEDPLSQHIIDRHGLIPLPQAIRQVHNPQSLEQTHSAKRRLAFNECFFNQIAALRRRAVWKRTTNAPRAVPDRSVVERYLDSLDFELTQDQSDSLEAILVDLESGLPMARLLQGEVGSGKTVVAIAAMLSVTGEHTGQAAMMAPTEVLAEQHLLNAIQQLDCRPLFGAAGPIYESTLIARSSDDRRLRVGLLTGSLKPAEKESVQRLCAVGEIDIVFGTHALLQDKMDFRELVLAVVDEQQRFGTEQRAALTDRTPRPHLLAMSATPIPRTLYMTFYGELDISTLRQLPHDRLDVETRWAGTTFEEAEAFELIRDHVARGRQAFVVCPLIDPSENVPGASAIDTFERLSRQELSDLRVALLHGRMSLAEKQAIMSDFRAGEKDVLVSTPVIEVGVDIPNATVMVILTSEQFGMSQLHQIRGRVGRGQHAGVCILVSDADSEAAKERLQSLVDSNDGFGLAAKDLEMRGPGRNLEQAQSGWSGWRFAHFGDLDLLRSARSAAESVLEDGPSLVNHPLLRQEVIRAVGKTHSAFA